MAGRATDSTNWHVAANWDSGPVPTDHNAAVIPPFTANSPIVNQSGQTAEVAYLTVESNAMLTVNPGSTLTVNRKLIQSGTITGGGTRSSRTWTGT